MGSEFINFDKGESSGPLTSQSFCKARALKDTLHLFNPCMKLLCLFGSGNYVVLCNPKQCTTVSPTML